MLKTMTIAAGVLAFSGGVALAQGNFMPPGPNAAPGGAGGSAPASTIGTPSANAQDTVGGTRSTTILSQTNKNQSAAGMSRSDYSNTARSLSTRPRDRA